MLYNLGAGCVYTVMDDFEEAPAVHKNFHILVFSFEETVQGIGHATGPVLMKTLFKIVLKSHIL